MQPTGALVLSLAALAAAAPSNERRAVDSGPFQIYAYGTGIGGLSLFSSGGDAYLGDHTTFNDSEASPVIFTSTDNIWTGAPNITGFDAGSTLPTWSNLTFSVPSAGSGVHEVGFTNSTAASDRQTSGFISYGAFILVRSTTGRGYESLWYATPSSVDGVYALKWNETGDASTDQIALTLKKTPPVNSETETEDTL